MIEFPPPRGAGLGSSELPELLTSAATGRAPGTPSKVCSVLWRAFFLLCASLVCSIRVLVGFLGGFCSGGGFLFPFFPPFFCPANGARWFRFHHSHPGWESAAFFPFFPFSPGAASAAPSPRPPRDAQRPRETPEQRGKLREGTKTRARLLLCFTADIWHPCGASPGTEAATATAEPLLPPLPGLYPGRRF